MTPPRVAVVLVTWNSAAHVGDAVRSVPDGVPALVVDNASGDGSAEVARRAGGRVLEAGANLGFGPACNLGAKATAPSETILFLNPDAALVDGPSCLAALLAELDRDSSVAAVVPALSGDGQERFQLRKLPTLGSLAREAFLVNRIFPRNPGFRSERYLDRARDLPFDLEQPAGAALLIRREVFEALGGFDPAFAPAWFEDVDLCARILESGRRLRYVPSARATHVGGTAMNALSYRDYLPLYTRNLLRYLGRHADWPTRIGARIVLVLGALLRLLLLPVVRGDHARPDAAAAYGRVLAGLLGLGWRSALLPSRAEA
ncbi:MAG TPA: glycosyltransferase family 2 protein [Thermoanaerobaculia bacterium]|nr:glycosyltransferase family 2 protein [Thermoanaerobaculia bacterium]